MPLANTVPEPSAITVAGAEPEEQPCPVVPSVILPTGSPFAKTLALPLLMVSPHVNVSPILATAGILLFM